MQSEADKAFQQKVMNFKETPQAKTTWEELEAYVGYKLEKGDRFKAFILTYLNRDFEPLDFDDGRQYYCTQKVCEWWGKAGYLKARREREYYKNKKETILKRQAAYFKNNVAEKRFYCGTCDVACISNYALKRHCETLKHNRLDGKKNKEVILKQQATYRKNNKDAIKEYHAAYRKNNKDAIAKHKATYLKNNRGFVMQCVLNNQMKNIESKKYYCTVCGLACISNYALKKHLDTLKHSYAWLNSLD